MSSKLEQLLARLCPDGVEFKPLSDICHILDSQRKPVTKAKRHAGPYPYYGANGIQDYVDDYIFDGEFVLVGEDGSVITKSGTPVVTWASGRIWVNNHAHVISEKEGTNLRFLFHYLQTVDIRNFVHGTPPKLTGKDFKSFQIPVPPLEVQNEIVRILDKFTELTAALTADLMAELTARRKQYEYYRHVLLTRNSYPHIRLREVGPVCMCKRILKSQTTDEGIPFYKIGTFGKTPDAYIPF
ncbi:MAG: restriction endonuclease subunit S, partial [Akkermansia sp.]